MAEIARGWKSWSARVRGVCGDLVVVSHPHNGFPYTQGWEFEALRGTKFSKLQRNSSVAVWAQSELGLVENSRPSPVFVNQFKEAVKRTSALLQRHRETNPPRATGPKLLPDSHVEEVPQ